jgi:hypothetical protein
MGENHGVSLTDLPFDIIDLVLSRIPSHRDLVSFAAVCKECKELVVPRHTEYRSIQLEIGSHAEVWAHLAQRPDLARNIQEVTISQGVPEHYPTTLVESTTSSSHPAAVTSDICQALRNMDSLQQFTWFRVWDANGPYSDIPDYQHGIFQALKNSPSLLQLMLMGPGIPWQDSPFCAEDYPVCFWWTLLFLMPDFHLAMAH